MSNNNEGGGDNILNFRGKYFDESSTLQTVANYSRLSGEYDEDLRKVNSTAAYNAASATWELVKHDPHHTRVLDVACGTGGVGTHLKESFNFQGVIDGVDGSGMMLDIARSRKIYRDLIEEIITPERSLFVREAYYDVTVCCVGFCVGHLDPGSFVDLVRSVRPGGYVVMVMGCKEEGSEYGGMMMREMAKLEARGKCSLTYKRKCGGEIDGITEAVLYCLRKASA